MCKKIKNLFRSTSYNKRDFVVVHGYFKISESTIYVYFKQQKRKCNPSFEFIDVLGLLFVSSLQYVIVNLSAHESAGHPVFLSKTSDLRDPLRSTTTKKKKDGSVLQSTMHSPNSHPYTSILLWPE